MQCESGRLLYVSDAVEAVLNFPQAEWFGKSLFDYIHPDDVEKLREQLSSGDQQSSGRILDLKSLCWLALYALYVIFVFLNFTIIFSLFVCCYSWHCEKGRTSM